jgi:hypothetical protein
MLELKNQDGQSVLEYVLLLAVVVSLAMTVFKSKAVQELLGPDSVFFQTLRDRYEFSYRYGSLPGEGQDPSAGNGYSNTHESYYNSAQSQTRFFTPAEPYP